MTGRPNVGTNGSRTCWTSQAGLGPREIVAVTDQVDWLAAYALGLAISAQHTALVDELLQLAERDAELLDAAAARVHALAVGDRAARRRAFELLTEAAASSRRGSTSSGTRDRMTCGGFGSCPNLEWLRGSS